LGCIFAQGAGGEVAGRRLNYICHEHDEPVTSNWRGIVVGDPDRSEDVWRVQFSETDSTEMHFSEVRVERVWY
jgi:hypothetical protein